MRYELPKYEQIPDLGLYLDQVTQYVNRYVEPIIHSTITTSMISNYVKKGMIEKPVKKLYDRNQIAYLIYICIAKQVMSLENMQILIDMVKEKYEPQRAYRYFCIEFDHAINYLFNENTTMPSIDESYSKGRILLRNTVLTIAHQIYLDYCFEELKKEI